VDFIRANIDESGLQQIGPEVPGFVMFEAPVMSVKVVPDLS
jgi:hypothetical protein